MHLHRHKSSLPGRQHKDVLTNPWVSRQQKKLALIINWESSSVWFGGCGVWGVWERVDVWGGVEVLVWVCGGFSRYALRRDLRCYGKGCNNIYSLVQRPTWV